MECVALKLIFSKSLHYLRPSVAKITQTRRESMAIYSFKDSWAAAALVWKL